MDNKTVEPESEQMVWYTRPKLGRKKKKETPDMRFQKETKDYEEAKKLNIWKTERRFADEFTTALEKLGIRYKIDRLTKAGPKSFMVAVLQQLRSPDIYSKLGDENKYLADRMGPLYLRRKVVEFITTSSHSKVQDMKAEFAKRKDKRSWDKFWDDAKKSDVTSTIWFIEATALFLNIDIILVEISDKEASTYFLEHISGNLSDLQKSSDAGPIVLCAKTNFHHQSILVLDGHEKLKKEDFEKYESNLYLSPKEKSETPCPNCRKPFKKLLQHISYPKSKCHGKVSDSFIIELREKSARAHKISKASSKRKIQTFETLKERKDRLSMHSYYMEKNRNKKRALQKQQEEKEEKEKPSKKDELPKKNRKSVAQIIQEALAKRQRDDQETESQDRIQSMTEME